jgi:hypothetical protein
VYLVCLNTCTNIYQLFTSIRCNTLIFILLQSYIYTVSLALKTGALHVLDVLYMCPPWLFCNYICSYFIWCADRHKEIKEQEHIHWRPHVPSVIVHGPECKDWSFCSIFISFQNIMPFELPSGTNITYWR